MLYNGIRMTSEIGATNENAQIIWVKNMSNKVTKEEQNTTVEAEQNLSIKKTWDKLLGQYH